MDDSCSNASARDRNDPRPAKYCQRCPAVWEPDDTYCWACGCPEPLKVQKLHFKVIRYR